MSIKVEKRRKVVAIETIHCDGPQHHGDTEMECDAITVDHGYGSPLDGDKHHFCGFICLRDWVLANKENAAWDRPERSAQ